MEGGRAGCILLLAGLLLVRVSVFGGMGRADGRGGGVFRWVN